MLLGVLVGRTTSVGITILPRFSRRSGWLRLEELATSAPKQSKSFPKHHQLQSETCVHVHNCFYESRLDAAVRVYERRMTSLAKCFFAFAFGVSEFCRIHPLNVLRRFLLVGKAFEKLELAHC